MSSEVESSQVQPIQQSFNEKPVALVIHQDEIVVNACREILEKQGFDIEFASNGTEGVQKVYRVIPDVILSGSVLPELNGYQVCRLIKNDPVMRKIPLILLADRALKMDRFWGMKAGADDFLQVGEIEAKLLRKVQMVRDIYEGLNIQEKQLLRQNHSRNPFNIRTRLNQILDTSLVESMLMVEFRSLADLVHDPALLNYMLFSLLESILEYDAAAIFYNNFGKAPRVITFHLPEGKKQPPKQIQQLTDAFFERFINRGLTEAQLELKNFDVIGVLDETVKPTVYATTYVKEILLDGQLVGALVLYNQQQVDYTQIFPVRLVEDEIRLLMKQRYLYAQAESLAVSDSLTSLMNHQQFMLTTQRELKAAQRYEQPLTLGIIEIDDFKRLNETWGHTCGDAVLKELSVRLDDTFRTVDILARLSGKRLAVLMPQTEGEQALIPMKRFQNSVSENPIQWESESLSVSVSCALVSLNEKIKNMNDLLHQAETLLMKAKNHGGNWIEVSGV